MRVEELARCWLDLSCAPVHLISLEANVTCVSFYDTKHSIIAPYIYDARHHAHPYLLILSVIANRVVDKYTIVSFNR